MSSVHGMYVDLANNARRKPIIVGERERSLAEFRCLDQTNAASEFSTRLVGIPTQKELMERFASERDLLDRRLRARLELRIFEQHIGGQRHLGVPAGNFQQDRFELQRRE